MDITDLNAAVLAPIPSSSVMDVLANMRPARGDMGIVEPVAVPFFPLEPPAAVIRFYFKDDLFLRFSFT